MGQFLMRARLDSELTEQQQHIASVHATISLVLPILFFKFRRPLWLSDQAFHEQTGISSGNDDKISLR